MEDVSAQPSVSQPPLKEASSLLNSKNLLLLLLALLIVGAVVLFVLILNQKKLSTSLQTAKESTVSLTKDYDNPFDKNTQYVNPFSEYKNPFDELIK